MESTTSLKGTLDGNCQNGTLPTCAIGLTLFGSAIRPSGDKNSFFSRVDSSKEEFIKSFY